MSVKINKNTMQPSLARITQELENITSVAYRTWVENTPVRSGNARRRTRLQGNTIRADYDYAVPLDQGRSRQSQKGMEAPTERAIVREVRRILRK